MLYCSIFSHKKVVAHIAHLSDVRYIYVRFEYISIYKAEGGLDAYKHSLLNIDSVYRLSLRVFKASSKDLERGDGGGYPGCFNHFRRPSRQ